MTRRMDDASIYELRETEKRLVEELLRREDAEMAADVDPSCLTLGDLRKLVAVVNDYPLEPKA